ncbi:LysR family transcriptional regulator [Halocynthiibacter sp. C4]|uniref:LysR family transcriptional regulator n=1 Tax=Halocynthiibacter sp. C4 TaxID=2992758 RepID=UPI00237B919A|nr:LysR family transcriptional regulator [Halocynthiibacter sp. C4]MDE0590665.1 LysR family transcriptional regulator [Halocynthiibacter sp. C4]
MRHLQIYRAIKTIAEQGSFRKASELLAISPSALVRQVKALEDELGAELFDRLPVGVRLSTVGEIYHRHFIGHLAEIERANGIVSDMKGMRIGSVSVAVSPQMAISFLPNEIAPFREEHPGVSFSTISTGGEEANTMLLAGSADLGLILEPTERSGVEMLASNDISLSLVLPIGSKTVLYPHELEDHDVILPSRGTGLRRLLDTHFASKRLSVRPAMEADVLLPPRLSPRPSFQFWPARGLSADLVQQMGGQVGIMNGMPRTRLALCQMEGRPLPIAAARFAGRLSEKIGV